MEASEVDKGQIQKLHNRGLNPTWFVRESWMQKNYGLRSDASPKEQPGPPPAPESTSEPPTADAPGDSTVTPALIRSKDDLIDVLRNENQFLKDALRKEQDRTGEDRQLTRELHVLLKNMQDRLLPAPTADGRIGGGSSPIYVSGNTVSATAPNRRRRNPMRTPRLRPQPRRAASRRPRNGHKRSRIRRSTNGIKCRHSNNSSPADVHEQQTTGR